MELARKIAARRLQASALLTSAAKRAEELILGHDFEGRFVAAAQQIKFTLREYVIQKAPRLVSSEEKEGEVLLCKILVPLDVRLGNVISQTMWRVDPMLPTRWDRRVVGPMAAYAASRIVLDNPSLMHPETWSHVPKMAELRRLGATLSVEKVLDVRVEVDDEMDLQGHAVGGRAGVELLLKKTALPSKVRRARRIL